MSESEVLAPPAAADAAFAAVAVRRVLEDVGSLVRCAFELDSVETERVETRAAGRGRVHLSFRFELRRDRRLAHGSLLLPLAEALELAARLLGAPEESLRERRAAESPAGAEKEALLELGNFVGVALDQAVHESLGAGWGARFTGCQGVRADVRPAFPYVEGEPLTLVRGRARLAGGEPFELLAMLPAFGAGA